MVPTAPPCGDKRTHAFSREVSPLLVYFPPQLRDDIWKRSLGSTLPVKPRNKISWASLKSNIAQA